jgi:uncharacterized protein YbjT (DUF2867 family)
MRIAVAGATGRVGRHVTDVLRARGHEVVAMSRSTGVDVVTGTGLAEALTGVSCVVDTATGASPDQAEATRFFTAAAQNLHRAGERAGVRRIVVVSILGAEKFRAGYNAAKVVHERVHRQGPLPVSIVRAAQFHELVGQMVDWGRQGQVTRLPRMRTQPLSARTVAERLADRAESDPVAQPEGPIEIAGPREETLADVAELLLARRGQALRVETITDPADPDADAYANGALLPGPQAILAGPTFEQWLENSIA